VERTAHTLEADRKPDEDLVLSVNNIEVIYDHVILVLKGVSLSVSRGGIVALLGANGAGKTTTLKAISNLLHAERGEVTKGSIEFDGERVDRLSPNELVRRGCIQVLEGRHCFGHLTIEENLLTGAFTRRDGQAAIRRDLEGIYDYFPRLRQRRSSMAGYTSGGEQQMCAIGRAMMSRPKMILLDEPSMGLAPQIVEEIFEIVRKLNETEGVSFLLAEQNTNMALKYATYGYILETGRVVMDGPASMLRENEDVKEFYLGVSEGGPQVVPRGEELQAPQALARLTRLPPFVEESPIRDRVLRHARNAQPSRTRSGPVRPSARYPEKGHAGSCLCGTHGWH
jgi:ABC-type branched-chain amino acid transport systems, ATPase component